MGLWNTIKGLLSGSAGGEAHLMDVAVRCGRCGEVIRGQVNLRDDLSVLEYDDNPTYFCRKGLVGSGANRCYQTVVVEYTFDVARNVVDRRIEGGAFVEEGE
jgi:hypothetical protein